MHFSQAVEKTIIVQVYSTVELPNLAALCNQQTGHYGNKCPGFNPTSFTTYGHINLQQVKMEICNIHFHIAPPMDSIFTTINELIEQLSMHSCPCHLFKQLVSPMYCFEKPSYCRISGLGIVKQQPIAHGRT